MKHKSSKKSLALEPLRKFYNDDDDYEEYVYVLMKI